MNKILFPFDLGSEVYQEAYVYAVKMARHMYAQLVLFNSFDIEVDNSITTDLYNYHVRKKWLAAFNEASKFQNYYIKKFATVKDEFEVHHSYKFVHGKFLPEFRKAVQDEKVELVVLPILPDKERNKKLFQILHNDIFENNEASALIVPTGYSFTPIKNILFATDLKKLKHHDLYLNDVLRYAAIFNAKIHFLHISASEKPVLPKDADAYRTMMTIIEMDKKHLFKSIHSKKIGSALHDYSKENMIDLLVTVKHEHSLLDGLLHKSTSDELVLKSGQPVLVMREKEKI